MQLRVTYLAVDAFFLDYRDEDISVLGDGDMRLTSLIILIEMPS